jgi:quercetin dioxygenase-like cupin family protein
MIPAGNGPIRLGTPPEPHEETGMRKLTLLAAALSALAFAAPVMAQDATKVDPKHYKVEFENDQVRVLRVNYGPHEKSVMHSHPATVAVYLTDGHAQFHMPDGKVVDAPIKGGTTQWSAAGKHLPENLGDSPFELILVEMKHAAAKPKPAAK